MKTKHKKSLILSLSCLILFILWTALLKFIDTAAIGPNGSVVAFSTINGYFHRLTGVNLILYTITDWLGVLPILLAITFAILGLCQWIKRKSLWKVDFSILALGVFYLITFGVFLFFEIFPINFRPILLEGVLEASYPSSTTMLSLCILPTAMMQSQDRIQNKILRRCILLSLDILTAFMVIGRILSGVHWLTDIIGGALFSTGLFSLYAYFVEGK